MTVSAPEPEDNDYRILKWSDFYNSDSTSHLSMEQNFELRKLLLDIRKPFSQGEEVLSPQSNTNRQVIKDLYDFTTEVVSALYVQHKGEIKILRQMTKDAMDDSMSAALKLHKELNDTENNGE